MDHSRGPFSSSEDDPEPDDKTIIGPARAPSPPPAPAPETRSRRVATPLDDTVHPTPHHAQRPDQTGQRREGTGRSRDAERRPQSPTLADSHGDYGDAPPADLAWHGEGAASNNALVDAARMIFSVVARLRLTERAPTVGDLRERIVHHLASFDSTLNRAHVPRDLAQDASYALCSFIDESVMSTPWGAQSEWGKLTLLSQRHDSRHGGKQFFELAAKAVREPARYIDLLEFLYICLCFGFRGAYSTAHGGPAQLEEIKEKIFREIRNQRGEGERDLSQHWRGVVDKRNPIVRYVPLWVVGAVCAAVLVAIFIGLKLTLAAAAAPVEQALNKIGRGEMRLNPNVAPLVVQPGVRRLKSYLENEITQGLVTVDEFPEKSLVRLASDRCFASGSAKVEALYQPALNRVATEINHVAGRVEVIGHSDNQPLTSLRYASNLELSRMRAEGVVKALTQFGVGAERLSADGRGDAEPIADNATPQGRDKNRRVEIVVYEGVTAIGAAPATLASPPAVLIPTPAPAPALFNLAPR